jgi:3-oxoacyl-[acyl-carrier-protein] synthase II
VAAPVPGFETPESWPRRKTRSMGRDSLFATRATELALADAGLLDHPVLGGGRAGVAYGCTQGSPRALEVYARQFYGKQTTSGIRGSDFIRFMSHTCAANVAQFFGLRGRIIPTTSACTSGSQGIG